jgi:hypothetical protein
MSRFNSVRHRVRSFFGRESGNRERSIVSASNPTTGESTAGNLRDPEAADVNHAAAEDGCQNGDESFHEVILLQDFVRGLTPNSR